MRAQQALTLKAPQAAGRCDGVACKALIENTTDAQPVLLGAATTAVRVCAGSWHRGEEHTPRGVVDRVSSTAQRLWA